MTILVPASRYNSLTTTLVEDTLTVEEILNISINQQAYTITMRSPGFEEELTRGILWTEDVYQGIENPQFDILQKNTLGYVTHVNVSIPNTQLGKGYSHQRNLMSVTSCGMCGKYETELELTGASLQPLKEISPSAILDMFSLMSASQAQFKSSGGCHAASAFTYQGDLLVCMEDIGRHNAVDKVVGSLLLHQKLGNAACLLVSGRISYEIVSKCFRAGIPYLAAVSAPSSMAVAYCKQKGIVLYAFCREGRATRYT